MKKILIIDDEIHIVELLRFNLENNGYKVDYSYDGFDGYLKTKEFQPDLILLDWMLPNISGIDLLKKIRSDESLEQIPVIMLTAKNMEEDKLEGLQDGADDYITKPFSVREVLARVKANLRKWDGIETSIKLNDADQQTLTFGPLTLDNYKYEAKVSGKSAELTLREFELLKFLATQQGQVFSREELLEKVWGYDYFGDVRTVDVTIRRIREKIEENPSEPEFLATKRGIGYYFNAN